MFAGGVHRALPPPQLYKCVPVIFPMATKIRGAEGLNFRPAPQDTIPPSSCLPSLASSEWLDDLLKFKEDEKLITNLCDSPSFHGERSLLQTLGTGFLDTAVSQDDSKFVGAKQGG